MRRGGCAPDAKLAPDAMLNTSAATMFSSDSSPGPVMNMPQASLEFDRLMEDTPDAEREAAGITAGLAKVMLQFSPEQRQGSPFVGAPVRPCPQMTEASDLASSLPSPPLTQPSTLSAPAAPAPEPTEALYYIIL